MIRNYLKKQIIFLVVVLSYIIAQMFRGFQSAITSLDYTHARYQRQEKNVKELGDFFNKINYLKVSLEFYLFS